VKTPRILVFDSGLGGLTVFSEIAAALPGAALTYLADDAVFPYGALAEEALVSRVMTLMQRFIPETGADLVVIACHTASTLVLPPLRAAFGQLFVGTVPAVKTGAARSASRTFSVLATPGTVSRNYTRALIAEHAADCAVTLVGAERLAQLAETALRTGSVDRAAIAREIAPAFVERADARTDSVVLACTHYPLILDALEAAAPWPVTWIDPAPAIARRAASLLGPVAGDGPVPARHEAIFTSGRPPEPLLAKALARYGLVAAERALV